MIFLLLFLQSVTWSADSCGLVFDTAQQRWEIAFPNRPPGEFQKIFSRDGQEVSRHNYLSNMVDLGLSFQQWLHQPGNQKFTEQLSYWHKLAQTGNSGQSHYWPEAEFISQAPKTAGEYRYVRKTTNEALVHLRHPSWAAMEVIRNSTQLQKIEIVHFSGIPHRENVPTLEGIPEVALPRYTVNFKGEHVSYSYPAARHIKTYLAEMEKSLQIIVNNWQNPLRKEVTLKALARYYHLGVVAHPFVRVNNSLLMTQVNVVLLEMGLRPVTHGEHDYIMRALDSERATKYFLEVVTGAGTVNAVSGF